MTLNDLARMLQEHLQPGPAGSARLVLDRSWLPEAGMLADFLELGGITIERAVLSPAGFTEVQVDGYARLLGTDQAVQLIGRVADGLVQLRLAWRPEDPAWRLPDSLPLLPEYLGELDGFLERRPSFFQDLTITAPAFEAATFDEPRTGIRRGLHLRGRLALTGRLARLTRFSGGREEVGLSGPIELRGTRAPIVAFEALLPDGGLQLGDLRLHRFRVRLLTVIPPAAEPGSPEEPEGVAELVAALDAGPLHLDVAVRLLQGDFIWSLQARPEPGTAVLSDGLSGLAALVSGSPDDFELPEPLRAATRFEVEEVAVGVAPESWQPEFISVTLRSPEVWRPVSQIQVRDLRLIWLFFWPLDRTRRKIRGRIQGTFDFGQTDPVSLEVDTTVPDFQVKVELESGDVIRLRKILEDLLGFAPPMPELEIDELLMAADPRRQSFILAGEAITGWSLELGPLQLELERIGIEVRISPGEVAGELLAMLTLAGQRFLVAAEGRRDGWAFEGRLLPGSQLDLATAAETLVGFDFLPALPLEEILLQFDTGTKDYLFRAQTAGFWEVQVTDDFLLQIRAAVLLQRQAAGAASRFSGELTGELMVNDFRVLTTYLFDPGRRVLRFEVDFQGTRIEARIAQTENPLGGTRTILTVDLGDLDLGAVLRYLADVAAPGLEIDLDEPWNLLTNLKLTNLALVVDLTDKAVGFEAQVDKSFGFVNVRTIGLLYKKKAGRSAIDLRITGSFLGTQYPPDRPLSWNVLDGKAPDVPGRGSGLLDIRYLGLGQRVALRSTAGIDTVAQAIDRLRAAIGPVDDSKPPLAQLDLVRFDRDSHWLIGLEIVALDTVQLAIVFNDPYLYGLLLRLQGPRAGALAGLAFEILYKKITDDIGMFKAEVQLPDAFRRIEVGAATLVLPVVALEIYTNGDFKVDLGFPRNRDFTRSFSLQIGPFMGYGGLYFAKLTGATSRRVPVITNGEFHPVLEFGLGLSVGLGKEIRKGPLKAGLSIAIEAILEGALAWFHPYDAAVRSDRYYWIQGTLALVGRLYGEVDFRILSVSIEVIAYASATFTIESYEPIRVALSVGVSVRASIKILFVRIRFSFRITLTESFTIGSKGTPPWIVAPREAPALPRAAARKAFAAAALAMEAADAPAGFDWTAGAVFAAPRTVELTALPAFTVADGGRHGVLLLTVASGEGGRPADTLVELLLSWAIRARLGRLDGEITAAQIDEVHDALQDAGMLGSAFRYENLSELLRGNLRVRIRGNADAPDDVGDVAVLPMIPELSYRLNGGEALSFLDHNPVDDDYSRRVAEYFRQLSVAFGQEPAAAESRDALAVSTVAPVRSAATVIFCDALLLLARTAAQAARDLLAALPGVERIGVSQLLADLVATGRSANAGAMLSRFLLHGLRLPSPADAGFLAATAAEIRAAGRTETALEPLYELTGQQFPVPAGGSGGIEITVEKSAGADWIELAGEAKDGNDGNDAGGTDGGGEAPPVPAGLVIRLTAAEVAAESPEPGFVIPFRGPEPLPLAQTVPVRSTLSRYLRWQGTGQPALPGGAAAAGATLWLFPQDLLARVETGATAGLPYELAAGHDTGGPGFPTPRIEPVRSYAWATALEVQVRRAVTPGGAFLPDTYLVLGANQTGRELLRGLWSHLEARPGEEDGTALHLLHRSPDGTEGALAADAMDLGGTFLLQTNLSTLTTSGVEFAFAARARMRKAAAPASGTYWASLGAPKAFLKLLWEGSVTGTGGYYLRYRTAEGQGLPEALFSDRGDATLWLVVLLESQTAAPPARTLSAFHNAAAVGDALDPAAVNVFAQAADGRGEQTRIASVPPGHTGFRLVRPSAELGDGTPDAAERAASLFSLLGYHLKEAGPFLSSNEGLPVGPQPPDGADPDDPAADWTYDRVVPVARFARRHPLPDSPFLPAPEGDPYAGLRRGAEATVAFAFRDVFGNPAGAASAIPDLPLPVGYTDDLIGVSAWPGVSGAYEVLPGDRPVLAVGFDFETAGYLPGAGTDPAVALATAAAHAERYRQIYYQVQQPDVTLRLHSSITPDASYEADKTGLAGLVQGAWVFLNGAGSLRAVAHAVAEGETLDGVAAAYSVTAAALGQAVSGVPAASLLRDAVRVPVYHRVSFGDTLESVAAETGLTLEELLGRNPDAADPLSPGASLLVAERALVAGPADTLAGIAAEAGVTVEQLAGFNRATALQPGASLPIPGLVELADGAGLTVPSQVRPGESLGAVAARLGLDLLDFARLHAALDLLAPGVEVRVDGLSATTRPGDSLNALAGRLGVSLEALAPAVAGAAGLPRPGAFVAGPAPGVGDPETLEELSARTGVSAGALARANAAVDGLLRPGATVTVRGRTLTAGAHETWNSLVERFRTSEPSVETSIEELAGHADVRTGRGLLRPGARVLVPPAPVRFGVPLDGTRNAAAIFEVAVDLEMARDAGLVHPDFAGVGKVALQRTPLAPRATPGAGSAHAADGALALQDLARRFQAALPELRLATGGRRTVGEDPRASRPLWAVRFARDGAAQAFSGFSLDASRPVFYALRPLSNRPVSRGGVPVRPYRSGEGLADPVPVNLQGVDLEVWARDFLAAVDLFLSPESAVAAFRSAPDAFEAVTGAKKTLADAIRLGVEPLLDSTGDGDGLEAAREAVRQRLLIELGPAYATDTLLQFRTSVTSPYADPATSATAPRLSGRPVSRVYRTGDAEGLATVAAAFGVSPSHLARVLAPVTKVLRAGLTVELAGSSATVQAGDSLASLAARLGVEAAALAGIAGLPEDTAGRLFAPGAVLPLTGLRRAAGPLDTFDSLADAFEISTATLAEAVQDVPGIFRAGAVLPLPGRPAVTVEDGDATLRQVAAGAGLSPADLAEGVIAVPGLFGPAFAARAVTLVPEHTLSSAKTPLIDGGSVVTFLLDVRAEAERRKVFLDLDYAVNELEHDVEAVAGVEGYQASSWLSFLLPLGADAGEGRLLSTALGLTEVPLPLRSAPLPPALVAQEEGPAITDPASLAEARQWTYGFRFQHQDAAQDSTFLRVVLNEDGGVGGGGSGGVGETGAAEGGALLGALAEFSSSWPALERDLARLREPGGEGDETARTAARAFAELARSVAEAWTEHWSPLRARLLKASRSVRQVYEYRITRTVRPGSEPPELETLVLAALSDPGPGGRFPGVSWVDAQGQAHPLVKESETAAECVYRYPGGVPAFTRQEHLCTVPGLDVVTLQNATAGLQVTRNADLVSTGPTREPFVYRTPFLAFSSPVLPLLTRDAVVSLRSGGEALEASLERFFRELAGPEDRPLPLVLRVAARYGYELVPGLGEGDPIVSLLPILLRPRFVYREGFAAELAAAVQSWEAVSQPNRQGGFYLFDVGVFSSLDESVPWPILDLTGLAWRLDAVAEPALAGVPQKRTAPRA